MISQRQAHRSAGTSLLLVLLLTACAIPSGLKPATSTPTALPSPTPTATAIPPAVSVNGEGITVPEFEAELARYQNAQEALGKTASLEDARKAVRNEFIDSLLLKQAAAAGGHEVSEAELQSRMDALAEKIGGQAALTEWQTANGYSAEAFKSDLRRQMAAAYMRDQITAAVPMTAEQVHVMQILSFDAETADKALGYLKAGTIFTDLAAQYDPLTKGELGWFPRGYLAEPAIEEAAFALQPGEYSDVIHVEAGYVILYVVERQPDRPLEPDAYQVLQQRALQDWLTQKRSESTILVSP